MDKSPDAFRTISEVAEWLGVQTHVLRFWESKFSQVKPVKRAGGRRYYRPSDMQLLGGIKKLLHDDGMTIKGVQKLLREEGVSHVAGFSKDLGGDDTGIGADVVAENENVVRFKARPEDVAEAVTEKDAFEDTASPLPAFLTQPMGGGSSDEAAKPKIVEAPDPPLEEDIAVQPGALSLMSGLSGVSADQAKDLAPLLGRLAVLRDRMLEATG